MRGPGHALSEHLQRSLATTNAAESLLGRTCYIKRNVKRWRERGMVRRWIAAGVFEVTKGFHRVKGCKDMPHLVEASKCVTCSSSSASRRRWLRGREPSHR